RPLTNARTSKLTVTVLTSVRNSIHLLPETVASIQAQTFADWEYIIVDDASEDGTDKWVEQAAKKDRRIRLIRRERQGGPFAAANTGLREARGEYIVRTDGDDLQPPHRIRRQLDFLQAHPEFRACITPWHSFSEQALIPKGVSQIPTRPRVLRWYLLLRTLASHSSLCIQRSALEEIGGYAELPAAADYRLVATLSRSGWMGVVPEVLSYVRRHEQKLSTTHAAVQQEIALDTMAVHMRELAGTAWPRQDLRTLWLVGHQRSEEIERGLEAISRWNELWLKDATLDGEDHKSLSSFSAFHRWLFLRNRLRKQPVRSLLNLMAMASCYPRLLAGRQPEIYA
ncbi:MAG: glycosyltransferase family 2 protein, partial [Acidobacteria bacterium]|nr:glycosyltransferase family 2 protein [Acidobacteriota bacterium]